MGLLNLFKRETPIASFEFEELERIFGNLQLKSLAVDKSAEFVARIFLGQSLSISKREKQKNLTGITC